MTTLIFLYDLKQPYLVAGCKALGLVCKLVTTPFWTLIEKKTQHILDMNVKCIQLTTFLRDATANVTDFMTGNIRAFPDIEIKEDCWYEDLVTPSKYDDDCASLLPVMPPDLAKLAENIFQKQLLGCIYSEPSEEFKQKTTSLSVHNKLCETVFARTDFLLQNKQNVSIITLESYTMFSFNKTSEWLDGKENLSNRESLQILTGKLKVHKRHF